MDTANLIAIDTHTYLDILKGNAMHLPGLADSK